MALYKGTSPYFNTAVNNGYLDVIVWRDIPPQTDDILFQVTKNYEYRPDLLAFDLYQDVNLWWVFASRNPSTLKDPIFDLQAGTQIYIPKITTLKSTLGM